jgi:hypothetical protein
METYEDALEAASGATKRLRSATTRAIKKWLPNYELNEAKHK